VTLISNFLVFGLHLVLPLCWGWEHHAKFRTLHINSISIRRPLKNKLAIRAANKLIITINYHISPLIIYYVSKVSVVTVDLLFIYLEIYLGFFELEILSQDLTQLFTLTNKNGRRTELNENKNKLLNRGNGRECSENCFFL
jgi:hypothetical protein